MKLHPSAIILTALSVLSSGAAFAAPTESQATAKARQLRADIAEKQKALAEEQRVDVPAPAAPAAPLELPIDTTDSPGATK